MTVDTEKYLEFVEGVTSNESLNYASLINYCLAKTSETIVQDSSSDTSARSPLSIHTLQSARMPTKKTYIFN